jgi:hypothetical protein
MSSVEDTLHILPSLLTGTTSMFHRNTKQVFTLATSSISGHDLSGSAVVGLEASPSPQVESFASSAHRFHHLKAVIILKNLSY